MHKWLKRFIYMNANIVCLEEQNNRSAMDWNEYDKACIELRGQVLGASSCPQNCCVPV